MSILYEIIKPEILINESYEFKKTFLSEIISSGSIQYYNKFKPIIDQPLNEIYTSQEILIILTLHIDVELFELILSSFKFDNVIAFFFNYANHNDNLAIRESVYNYIVENHSDLIIDNMDMYEKLLKI